LLSSFPYLDMDGQLKMIKPFVTELIEYAKNTDPYHPQPNAASDQDICCFLLSQYRYRHYPSSKHYISWSYPLYPIEYLRNSDMLGFPANLPILEGVHQLQLTIQCIDISITKTIFTNFLFSHCSYGILY